MKVYDAASIRNVAVVGHGGSGKTQLVSALLFDAGMVNRLGKVDEGNTVVHSPDPGAPRGTGRALRALLWGRDHSCGSA